jgi:hypothetical protein
MVLGKPCVKHWKVADKLREDYCTPDVVEGKIDTSIHCNSVHMIYNNYKRERERYSSI